VVVGAPAIAPAPCVFLLLLKQMEKGKGGREGVLIQRAGIVVKGIKRSSGERRSTFPNVFGDSSPLPTDPNISSSGTGLSDFR
jgi:hypothetical protein